MQNRKKTYLSGFVLTPSVFVLFFLSCSFANGQTAPSAIPKADARVASALKETNTEFEVSSKDGGYKITYATKGNRTQVTHAASGTETIHGVEMRLIFSFAMIAKTSPTQQTANMLLQANMETVGLWGLQKLDDGSYAVVKLLYVPADAGGKQLEGALMSVATLADEMEEKLTKKDVN